MNRTLRIVLGILFAVLLVTIFVSGRYRVTNTQPDFPVSAPVLESLDPDTGTTGTAVSVKGTGFTPGGNLVMFGQGYITDITSADGTTLVFTVPDGLDLCAPGMEMCPEGFPKVLAGTYAVKVSNSNGVSNELSFTVTE